MLALLEVVYVINMTSGTLINEQTDKEKEEIGEEESDMKVCFVSHWVFSRDKG